LCGSKLLHLLRERVEETKRHEEGGNIYRTRRRTVQKISGAQKVISCFLFKLALAIRMLKWVGHPTNRRIGKK
jgi:hypothetical protein